MENILPEDLQVSIGTRMFNFFGLLALLYKLNINNGTDNKRIICSPLSDQSQIKISRSNIWGVLFHGPPIHLLWREQVGYQDFTTDYLFDDNIDQCINSENKFIIISLFIDTFIGGHANYIIIHSNQAYRIEPHGHGENPGNYSAEKLDVKLSELFSEYGIIYKSHAYFSGEESPLTFSENGLQTQEYIDGVSKIPLKPGLCNTYVFMYIDEICKFSIEHPELKGYKLFHDAINNIDKRYAAVKGEADSQAISYNLWLLEIQQVFHDQLIEARLLYEYNTRGQYKKLIHAKTLEARKLKLNHFSVDRASHDVLTMVNVLSVIIALKQRNILTIYGLDFEKLYEHDQKVFTNSKKKRRRIESSRTLGGSKKKKKTKKKKKKKLTKKKKKKLTKKHKNK